MNTSSQSIEGIVGDCKPKHPFFLPSNPAPTVKNIRKKKTGDKKRPYRRTKRPKNYCDRSTITTVTEQPQQNAFDSILAEASDLMQAAAEAQQLGRFKMASAYLLLLHARLVGLGKRFDKAIHLSGIPSELPSGEHKSHSENPSCNVQSRSCVSASGTSPSSEPTPSDDVSPTASSITANGNSNEPSFSLSSPAVSSSLSAVTPKTQAARRLASILPPNIELDAAMMEHLAKAAAELHAARSGRNRGVAPSPDAREFLANTANQRGMTTATLVAWRRPEKIDELQQAGKTPREIACMTGRTERQVKAYISNRDEREKVAHDWEELSDESSKKKGGRGKKPATAAMTTVPYANCDARCLLQGGLLE